MADLASIIRVIRSAHPESGDTIPLHAPVMGESEKLSLMACVDSGFVSTVGENVNEFEDGIAKFCESAHAVATVNGTAALHIALLVAGVQQGDLVLTQSLSFVATANAISQCGAVPVFIDINSETLGFDPVALEAYLRRNCIQRDGFVVDKNLGRRVAACVPMSTFGFPADLPKIAEICRDYDLPLVEDAAEALGSSRDGKHVGTFGQLGVLSFNGNKVITTGGGGAIITDDTRLSSRARHLSTTAKQPHPWEYFHDERGFNYRMPNLNAAFGCAQLKRLPGILADKRRLATEYSRGFADIGVHFLTEPAGSRANYWLSCILLSGAKERDDLLHEAASVGVQCRPAWTPLHLLPMYDKNPRGELVVTEDIANRLVCLPSSPRVTS